MRSTGEQFIGEEFPSAEYKLRLQTQLDDIEQIDFSKHDAELYPCDREYRDEILRYVNPHESNVLYIVMGAAAHLLPVAVETESLGLDTILMGRGGFKGHEVTEKRVTGVLKYCGIETPDELKATFLKKEKGEASSSAVFILDPQEHILARKSLSQCFTDVLNAIEGTPRQVVLISEGSHGDALRLLETKANTGEGKLHSPRDLIADYCYRNKVQLRAFSFGSNT